jgi:uncharacterized repeat protein (TIGR03803 family)
MKLRLKSAVGGRLMAFAFALGLLVAGAETPRAQAQTFSVIHNFTGGSDGGNPLAGFAIDAAGNFYGTTSAGGASGEGTVFKVTAKGKETVLYTFTGGADGANPEAGLFVNATNGNLYGTTNAGGAYGAGTVFGVTAKGKETILYSFTGKTDGANPQAALVMDAKGNLYGTTFAGGIYGNGTVFKLGKKGGKWTEQALFSFSQDATGKLPLAGVTLDADGNLYGTTSAGGTYTNGNIFELKRSKSGWTEIILHNFENASDGAVPYGGLIFDQSGNLYGAATEGGTGGGGTIFELTPSNDSWTFTVLYSLPGWGVSGTYRNLLLDASGNIYATTHCDGDYNAGTIYELTQSGGTWTYTSLYVFTGGSDGQFSYSNLVFDKLGNLYGTTKQGGADGNGVIFKVKP